MADEMIRMPDRDEMANRLVAVDGDGRMVRGYYPHLLNLAGDTVSPHWLVVTMNMALTKYARDLNEADRNRLVMALLIRIGTFVRALVDDEYSRILVYEIFESIGVAVNREE